MQVRRSPGRTGQRPGRSAQRAAMVPRCGQGARLERLAERRQGASGRDDRIACAGPTAGSDGTACGGRLSALSIGAGGLKRRAPLEARSAIGESLHVTKGASLAAALALGVLSPPSAAVAEPFAYPPQPVAWIVGPGY